MIKNNKSVLVVIGAGVAALKVLTAIRLLMKKNISIETVLTKDAQQFVTPLSVASLSQGKVHTDLFDIDEESKMNHIALSRRHDMILVAPATADLIAKMAHGFANDLASTVLLASAIPIIAVPAMNHKMWLNPATRRNVEQLEKDGIEFIMPIEGDMACGEFGIGRIPEAEVIADYVNNRLAQEDSKPLAGYKVLITAGPTHEAIDPVRYLASTSSGKQGFALASEAKKLGAEVILITGPVNLVSPMGVKVIKTVSARQMHHQVMQQLPVDIAIMNAAVSDFRPKSYCEVKIKKSDTVLENSLPREWIANPDILYEVANSSSRPQIVIGFAAESQNIIKNAKNKLTEKNCDWIIANRVDKAGGNLNQIHIITKESVQPLPLMTKDRVAEVVIKKLSEILPNRLNFEKI